MHEVCESNWHECTSKGEVEKYKEEIVVENDELTKKTDMKNKEKIWKNMKISHSQYESELWNGHWSE